MYAVESYNISLQCIKNRYKIARLVLLPALVGISNFSHSAKKQFFGYSQLNLLIYIMQRRPSRLKSGSAQCDFEASLVYSRLRGIKSASAHAL